VLTISFLFSKDFSSSLPFSGRSIRPGKNVPSPLFDKEAYIVLLFPSILSIVLSSFFFILFATGALRLLFLALVEKGLLSLSLRKIAICGTLFSCHGRVQHVSPPLSVFLKTLSTFLRDVLCRRMGLLFFLPLFRIGERYFSLFSSRGLSSPSLNR